MSDFLAMLIAAVIVIGYVILVWAVRILMFVGAIYLAILALRAFGVAI